MVCLGFIHGNENGIRLSEPTNEEENQQRDCPVHGKRGLEPGLKFTHPVAHFHAVITIYLTWSEKNEAKL
jgi:hypothetical protein